MIRFSDIELAWVVMLAALAASIPVGLRAGREGTPRVMTLMQACARTGMFIIIGCTLMACGKAVYYLTDLPNNVTIPNAPWIADQHSEWSSEHWGVFSRVRPERPISVNDPHWRADMLKYDLINAKAVGYTIGTIAPVLCVAGTIPSSFVVCIAYHFGTRRRAEDAMARGSPQWSTT